MYNINLPPVLVRDAEQAAKLGDAWRPIDVLLLSPTRRSYRSLPPATRWRSRDGNYQFPRHCYRGRNLDRGNSGIVGHDCFPDRLRRSVDGDVTYAVTANTAAERTADITVNGKTFAITQAAGV